MAEVVIEKNKLENYRTDKKKFVIALQKVADNQRDVLNSFKEFLFNYLQKDKAISRTADAQNYYFSKKQAEDFAKLAKEKLISNDNIASYVSSVLSSKEFSDYFPSSSNLANFKKKITNELQQILTYLGKKANITENNTTAKEILSKQKTESSLLSEKDEDKVENSIEKLDYDALKRLFSKNYLKGLQLPIINLNAISKFLDVNVFTNIENVLSAKNWRFELPTSLIEENMKKVVKRSNQYTESGIWNPTMAHINAPFVAAENFLTKTLFFNMKSKISAFSKKFFEKLNNFANFILPFTFIRSVLKIGFGIARFTFKTAFTIINFTSRVVSFTLSSIRAITKTIANVGKQALSFLGKSLKAITRFKLFKFTGKFMLAFFKSYTGAYILGYIIGTIYGKLKNIIDFFKNIGEKLKEALTPTIDFLKKKIYNRYISPILDWIERRRKDTSFYARLVADIFTDADKTFEEKLNTLETLFDLRDEHGSSLRIIGSFIDMVEKVQDFFKNIDEFKAAIFEGGAKMLGGFAGSMLGGFAFSLIPGIGPFLAPLGSMAGGWLGEKLTGIVYDLVTKKSKIDTQQNTGESEIDRYIRTHLGGGTSFSETTYGTETPEHIQSLITIGKIAKAGKLEKSEELDRFQAEWGIDLRSRLANASDEEYAKTIAGLRSLVNLRNISTDRIAEEISESLEKMKEVIDAASPWAIEIWGDKSKKKQSPRGFMTIFDIKALDKDAKYLKSIANLNGEEKTFWKWQGNINPYWVKIGRDLLFMNAFRALQAKQIDPIEFLKRVNALDNLDNFSYKQLFSGENDFRININNHRISISDLITGNYFKNPNKTFGSEFDSDFSAAVKYSMGQNMPWNIGTDKEKVIGYFPLKNEWSLDFMFKGTMADLDLTNVLTSGTKTYGASSISSSFSSSYDSALSALRKRGGISQENLDMLSDKGAQDDVAIRLNRLFGKNAAERFSSKTADEQSRILERIMEDVISPDTTLTIGDSFLKSIDSITENLSQVDSNEYKDQFRQALQKMQRDENGLGMNLKDYQELLLKNNVFLKNEVIPKLQAIAKAKGINSSDLLAMVIGRQNANAYEENNPIGSDMTLDSGSPAM